MALSNLERMIQLAEDVFAYKSDPNQLDVDQEVMERLYRIHPATVSEFDDGNGPVAWVLLIPTTMDLMNRFLEHEISEKELFDLTPEDSVYDALYLCSALVLEEYRRKGITKQLTLAAIENIRKDHPIKALFVWAFSREGDLASEKISRLTSIPLMKRGNYNEISNSEKV
jgi:GNAT superfamily N-acetyltransferase